MKAIPIRFIILLSGIIVMTAGCSDGDRLVGDYTAFHPGKDEVEVYLSLKADGRGSWVFEGEEALFNWEVKNDEIWLHTPSGGLIVGDINSNALHIVLPGVGGFTFTKQ